MAAAICQTSGRLKAAAPYLVKVGEREAKTGDIEKAVATFQKSLKWNPQLKFDPQSKA